MGTNPVILERPVPQLTVLYRKLQIREEQWVLLHVASRFRQI
jgi:hypothetical protein